MADATDLKSVGLNGPCRFESGHRQIRFFFVLESETFFRKDDGMRIGLAIFATLLVGLGIYLIALGFLPGDATVAPGAGPQVAAKGQATAGPIGLGLALLAGGTLFFVMLLRRR